MAATQSLASWVTPDETTRGARMPAVRRSAEEVVQVELGDRSLGDTRGSGSRPVRHNWNEIRGVHE
jgi:hypothetical protein